MKPKLIILSDVWGKEKSNWILGYVEIIKDKFDIQYYDCCELGGIDKSIFTEQNLHNQFVNGGIEIAVENLLNKEKGEIKILAFSIGGTIAWKAALKGLKVSDLVAVSSTRLRNEIETPNCRIRLLFGENDVNKPSLDWLKKQDVSFEIYNDMKHEMYVEANLVKDICDEILK
ncbi:MAG: alpha/beta hydrolase [Paludibacter sp.]|nr:alpha/beta hydrolase [Paludibacter sp.]